MADSTATANAPTAPAAGTAAPISGLSPTFLSGRTILWTSLMLLGVASLVPISGFVSRELETWSLIQADEQTIRQQLAGTWSNTAPAQWLEALAELGLQVEPAEPGQAHARPARRAGRRRARYG